MFLSAFLLLRKCECLFGWVELTHPLPHSWMSLYVGKLPRRMLVQLKQLLYEQSTHTIFNECASVLFFFSFFFYNFLFSTFDKHCALSFSPQEQNSLQNYTFCRQEITISPTYICNMINKWKEQLHIHHAITAQTLNVFWFLPLPFLTWKKWINIYNNNKAPDVAPNNTAQPGHRNGWWCCRRWWYCYVCIFAVHVFVYA